MNTESLGRLGGVTETSASGTAGATSALGKDSFMKLLLAQLGNQDPTQPMDSHAFVAQLAQFSMVEQMQTQTSSLETLIVAQAAGNQIQAASLVGKEVLYKSDKIHLDGVSGTSIRGELKGDANSITAVIKDSSGKVVRTLTSGAQSKGATSLEWDGLDDQGNPLPAGDYTVGLSAATKTGDSVAIDPRGNALVTGISFENGFPELLLGSLRIQMSDVVQIHDVPKESPTP